MYEIQNVSVYVHKVLFGTQPHLFIYMFCVAEV